MDDVLTFATFVALLGEHLQVDLGGAAPEAQLRDDLGFDSLQLLEAVVLLEQDGVVLPDDLIAELRTLGDLHHYAAVLHPSHPFGGAGAAAAGS